MNMRYLFVTALAMAIAFALCGSAFAADAATPPAAPAAKPAAPAPAPAANASKDAPKADTAKPAAKPAEPMTKCTVKGKLSSKMVTNKKTGKERKVFAVAVTEAKGDDGKPLDSLKGKTLGVVGLKPEELEKFVGKDVEIKGEAGAKRIKAASIK